MNKHEATTEVAILVEMIRPLLAGRSPEVVSATLADLLSMWLAGHFVGGDKENAALREQLLADHVELVRRLIPVNEQMILEQRDRTQDQ